jgi:hypothetical protein
VVLVLPDRVTPLCGAAVRYRVRDHRPHPLGRGKLPATKRLSRVATSAASWSRFRSSARTNRS